VVLIGITGATGIPIAIKLLEILKEKGIDRELIISIIAEKVIELESDYSVSEIRNLASKNYDVDDLTAA